MNVILALFLALGIVFLNQEKLILAIIGGVFIGLYIVLDREL